MDLSLLILTVTRQILSSLSSVCSGCEYSYREGTNGKLNSMSMADGQEELNPPREVDGGRKPKFMDKASDKTGLTSV